MGKFRKVAALPALKSAKDIFDFITKFDQPNINEQDIKQNLKYLASLFSGWTDRYAPTAFYEALETDKSRGYNDTKESQGAFEMTDPKLLQAVEDFKKNPPKNLKDFVTDEPIDNLQNITVPESSNRYKSMRDKLTASSTKFVKVSAKEDVEELKKVIPEWTIQDVLTAMQRVAEKEGYSVAEKQMEMTSILSQYEKEIAPLSQYLEKNGIQPK
jgi:hypothetical protein